MASTTGSTTTAKEEPLAPIFEPNVQPDYLDIGGDRKWRDWRLRRRRPDLRQRFAPTFPNVNPAIVKKAQELIDEDTQEAATYRKAFRRRSLKDLNDSEYLVEQLQFRPIAFTENKVDSIWASTRPRKQQAQDELDKLPTFFFEEISTSLFARVWDFAAQAVGQQAGNDITQEAVMARVAERNWTQSFLRHLPEDFVRIASVTARADPNFQSPTDSTGYEYLFVDRESRINLCTSVIGKLLQEHCLDSLLFGARKIEREALRKIDESQDEIADGFSRKMSRAASVPKYLTQDLFTVNFWPEVDRVTLGILKLLLPLINFAGQLEPDAPWPELTELHQSLHNIVAEAGWLANGLAKTRSCFWIDFPQPGQLWDLRQEHVTDTIWTRSRAAATVSDNEALADKMRAWQERENAAYNTRPDRKQPLSAFESEWARANPRPRQSIRRTAKVQVALWPFLERSFPYRQDLVSGDINSGESTTVLQKAQVVYYAGVDDDKSDQEEDVTLSQYLDDYEKSLSLLYKPRALLSLLFTIFAMLLLAAALLSSRLYIVRDIYVGSRPGGSIGAPTFWSGWGMPRVNWPALTLPGEWTPSTPELQVNWGTERGATDPNGQSTRNIATRTQATPPTTTATTSGTSTPMPNWATRFYNKWLAWSGFGSKIDPPPVVPNGITNRQADGVGNIWEEPGAAQELTHAERNAHVDPKYLDRMLNADNAANGPLEDQDGPPDDEDFLISSKTLANLRHMRDSIQAHAERLTKVAVKTPVLEAIAKHLHSIYFRIHHHVARKERNPSVQIKVKTIEELKTLEQAAAHFVERDTAGVHSDFDELHRTLEEMENVVWKPKKPIASRYGGDVVWKKLFGDGGVFNFPYSATATVDAPVKDTPVGTNVALQPGVVVTNARGDFEYVLKTEFEADNGKMYKAIIGDKFAAFLDKLKADNAARASSDSDSQPSRVGLRDPAQPLDQPFQVSIAPDTVFMDPANPGQERDMAEGFWLHENILGNDYACFIKTKEGVCFTGTAMTEVPTETVTETKTLSGIGTVWETKT